MKIIYDGDCPFCSRYVKFIQLKKTVGKVELINARLDLSIQKKLKNMDIDINEGMVLIDGDDFYFGEDCIHRLALLSTPSNMFNRVNKFIFRHKWISYALYPILKRGRNLVLLLLGRQKI